VHIEFGLSDQIDNVAVPAMEMVEADRQDIVAIWFEVEPTGETLEEFTERVNAEFAAADVI
jgi:hypothetical protein